MFNLDLDLINRSRKVTPLLFLLILANCVFGQEEGAKQTTDLPFNLGVGLSMYKPSMTDANNFFKSYQAGRFGSGRGYNMKFIMKKRPMKKFGWTVTLDYFFDSIEETDPHVSLSEHNPRVEPNYISSEKEKLSLRNFSIMVNHNYWPSSDRNIAFSTGLGTGLNLLWMKYDHAETCLDGYCKTEESHIKLVIPTQVSLAGYRGLSESLTVFIEVRYIYFISLFSSKPELGYDVDPSGFAFGAGIVISQ